MKIKNRAKGITPDAAIIITCVTTLFACPLRIFLMIRNMERETGFYIDYNNVVVYVFYGLLLLASVLILVLTFLSARVPASIPPGGRRIPLALTSLVFAATLFYDAVSSYVSTGESGATLVQNFRSLSLMRHMHSLFALISCCYFFVVFLSYVAGKDYYRKIKLIALSPLAWAVVKILEKITTIISIMRVSELFLELLAYVFLAIFFMSFARVQSKINSKGTMWSVIAAGCVSVMITLSYSIPRIMLIASGQSEVLVNGYPLNIADIGCSLFILVYIITVLRKGYNAQEAEQMDEYLKSLEEKKEGGAPVVKNEEPEENA